MIIKTLRVFLDLQSFLTLSIDQPVIFYPGRLIQRAALIYLFIPDFKTHFHLFDSLGSRIKKTDSPSVLTPLFDLLQPEGARRFFSAALPQE